MSGKGNKSRGVDKSITVAEYCRQFFEKLVSSTSGDVAKENEKAAENFYTLVKKLQEAGNKDDVKVPLRVLRDEIGRVYFGSARKRTDKITLLFGLYDGIEAGAQNELKGNPDAKTASSALQLLDDLRQRFVRLVIGDTWEAWPELKLMALKRMQKYAVAENEALRVRGKLAIESPPPTPSAGKSGSFGRKLTKTLSNAPAFTSGGSMQTWQAAINDLAKAPGAKLVPLIKLLLLETVEMADTDKAGIAEEVTEQSAGGAELRTQPSNVSEVDLAQKVSDFTMDDLLGLNEAPEEPEGDPFQAPRAEPPPPQAPIQAPAPQYAAAFHSPPLGQQPAGGNDSMPGSSNPFGAPNAFPHAPSTATNGYGRTTQVIASPYSGYAQQYPEQPPLGHVLQSQDSFEQNAFGSQPSGSISHYDSGSLPSPGYAMQGGLPPMYSPGQQAPSGFNPFGLPSTSYRAPVPPTAENRFEQFNPIPPALVQAQVPQPMRAPPAPPSPRQ